MDVKKLQVKEKDNGELYFWGCIFSFFSLIFVEMILFNNPLAAILTVVTYFFIMVITIIPAVILVSFFIWSREFLQKHTISLSRIAFFLAVNIFSLLLLIGTNIACRETLCLDFISPFVAGTFTFTGGYWLVLNNYIRVSKIDNNGMDITENSIVKNY